MKRRLLPIVHKQDRNLAEAGRNSSLGPHLQQELPAQLLEHGAADDPDHGHHRHIRGTPLDGGVDRRAFAVGYPDSVVGRDVRELAVPLGDNGDTRHRGVVWCA